MHHGGTSKPANPPDHIVAFGAQLIAWVQKNLGHTVYARVDGLDTPGGFVLMELELIDPWLYFSTEWPGDKKNPGVQEFAHALLSAAV